MSRVLLDALLDVIIKAAASRLGQLAEVKLKALSLRLALQVFDDDVGDAAPLRLREELDFVDYNLSVVRELQICGIVQVKHLWRFTVTLRLDRDGRLLGWLRALVARDALEHVLLQPREDVSIKRE